MSDFPNFDMKNGLFIQNLDDPISGALMEWGIPSCLLDFSKDILSQISPNTLGGFALGIQEGREAAQNKIADTIAWAFRDTGWMEVDADTGKIRFLSSSSRYGIDAQWAEYAGFGAGVLEAVGDLYGELSDIYEATDQCFGEIDNWFKLISGEETGSLPLMIGDGPGGGDPNDPADPANHSPFQKNRQGEFLIAKLQVSNAIDFSNRCTSALGLIAEVLSEQELEAFKAVEEDLTRPIFRLVFGPPEAKKGQFLLSRDGLYYDSQTRQYADGSPIPTRVVMPGDAWGMQYDPNLGGKGTTVALSDLGKYVDTFFDANQVNSSPSMQSHYEKDHFLQVLESQKHKEVYDLSSHVNDLVVSGYDAKSALVINLQQSIFAAIDRHTFKINKRKKQIEIAFTANAMFGSEQTFRDGEVPINDFSYLSGINLDVDIKKQRSLVFDEGEVSGVVLPLQPKFVKSARAEAQTLIPPLIVPPVGAGGIISIGEFSSTDAPVLSLTDHIITDKMFAIYNFLNADLVGVNSDEYKLINCSNKLANNAQLIAADVADVYDKGLGIAKLKGINRQQYKAGKVYTSGLGSFVKIPNSIDFQDLLYNPGGATIEAWVHIPKYGTSFSGVEHWGDAATTTVDSDSGDWADYNYYKLLLACENTGGTLSGTPENMQLEGNTSIATKGFVMGFSRDPQIYSTERVVPGSDINPASALLDVDGVALPASATVLSSCFFLATTQSVNSNDVEFVSVSGPSPNELRYLKMVVDASTTVGGANFNSVSGDFVHINVAFDPVLDEVRIHLDGNLMATSALSEVFGVERFKMPNLPTFITPADTTTSSFYYYSGTVNQLGTSAFNEGPNNYTNSVGPPVHGHDHHHLGGFTPWIVGGGWTDGIEVTDDTGGFMVNKHGYRSALDGYVGSLKFYSKALTTTEAEHNYKAQKDFFKNIKI